MILIIILLLTLILPAYFLKNKIKKNYLIKEGTFYLKKLDQAEATTLAWPAICSPLLLQLINKGSSILRVISADPSVTKLRSKIIRHLVALLYRLELLDKSTVFEKKCYFSILKEMAFLWYENHPLHAQAIIPSKCLNELLLASSYPLFIDRVLVDADLADNFFEWILQDGNSAEVFIQYPATQQELVECNLANRLQAGLPTGLRIVTADNQKYLALLIEGKYVNILEKQEKVVLKGGWILTIQDIFNIFKRKNIDVGNLEFFTTGVTNWNAHVLGHWDALKNHHVLIDMDQPYWWTQLPLLEVIDKSAARQRYHFAVDGKHWIAVAKATRGNADLDYDQSHAFLQLAIPARDGRYAIYDFGKCATIFPKNMLETLLIFANSVHAAIAYPDENSYYTHRQHAQHAFALTATEGLSLMQIVRHDILKGRQKNIVYQIESENCAKWVQTVLQAAIGIERVPNMFVMPLINSEPKGAIAGLFRLLKIMPFDLPSRILVALHFPLGAWRGTWIVENEKTVWKSLIKHPFWHSGLVYLPAFLHHQRLNGTLSKIQGSQGPGLLRRHHFQSTAVNLRKTYSSLRNQSGVKEIFSLVVSTVSSENSMKSFSTISNSS